ncbi:MFS transporter [Streptomyces pseudovenezuelae]|uniref:hypothetical protein n=1 Tax=Streptomyces pseudovenezuelae TaxID=67350 RepID=UPI002E8054F3|nr:hypothetical protein [Streptomyces pseudovenezuelae]WUA92861.1 MFS transporter [Streptomyces pseudovenezuelae]
MGLAGLVGLAPMAAAALWAGALADVRDRRRVLLTTTAGIGVTSLLLWAQAWADLRSVGALLVLVGAQQALFGANSTVSRAVTPRLVRPELLPAANALQSMVLLSAGVAGTAAGRWSAAGRRERDAVSGGLGRGLRHGVGGVAAARAAPGRRR